MRDSVIIVSTQSSSQRVHVPAKMKLPHNYIIKKFNPNRSSVVFFYIKAKRYDPTA